MSQPREAFSGTYPTLGAGAEASYYSDVFALGIDNKTAFAGLMLHNITANSGGTTQFKLELEHSIDGKNWPNAPLEVLIAYASGIVANYAGQYKIVTSTATFGPYIRLKLSVKEVGATNIQWIVGVITLAAKPF